MPDFQQTSYSTRCLGYNVPSNSVLATANKTDTGTFGIHTLQNVVISYS